ncbi:MAG TPA: nuclear transport factor 2 family protein [Actinopolymorphaceae bacterium]|nr:nuclear transport factor 2 family protein [Actinopolymorphaceae bacterium]
MAGRLRTLVAGAMLATLAAMPAAQPAFSATTRTDGYSSSCADDLDRTLERFTTTLLGRDLEGYMRLWDDDAVLILNSGRIITGKAGIREFYVGFFDLPGWTETFDEVSRQIFDCQTAYVVDNVLFEIPESGVRSPLAVSLTFTREHGRWVVVGEHITGVAA